MTLTRTDRDIIARARELAAASGPEAVREHTGISETDMAYVTAFGKAQYLIRELTAIVARQAADAGEADPLDVAGRLADLEQRAERQS